MLRDFVSNQKCGHSRGISPHGILFCRNVQNFVESHGNVFYKKQDYICSIIPMISWDFLINIVLERDHPMRILTRIMFATALLAASASALAANVTKAPDLGEYWSPLSRTGSYAYANSFVANASGPVSELGLWLRGGPTNLQLKVFDSIGGNVSLGPDANSVLASTGVIPGQTFDSLTFLDISSGITSAMLVAGHTYWFAASTVGQSGTTGYSVGGHTQNTGGIHDNGTFWYSNDPAGIYFAGMNKTPELAFSVSISAVPEPSSYALYVFGFGLLGVLASRRRRDA